MSSLKKMLGSFCLAALGTALMAFPGPDHSAVKPVPRDPNWVKRHDKFVEIAKRGGVEVLFLGDSITDAWGGEGHGQGSPGSKLFEEKFVPLKAANFGIGGDRTQHVLWRLQNGELKGITPKVVMLMIGTNNSNGKDNTAEEIADGVKAIVAEIQKQSPTTKVLLLAIFPRATGNDANLKKLQSEKINKVNEEIVKLHDGKKVKFLNINKIFTAADGSLPRDLMPDQLHLSPNGYALWAKAVEGEIKALIGSEPAAKSPAKPKETAIAPVAPKPPVVVTPAKPVAPAVAPKPAVVVAPAKPVVPVAPKPVVVAPAKPVTPAVAPKPPVVVAPAKPTEKPAEKAVAPESKSVAKGQGSKTQSSKTQAPKAQSPKAQAPKAQAPKGQAPKGANEEVVAPEAEGRKRLFGRGLLRK